MTVKGEYAPTLGTGAYALDLLCTNGRSDGQQRWFGEPYAAPLPVDFDYDGLIDRLQEAGHEPPPF
ncbi:hypothetical protein [Streptomyces sp. NPDC005494]|uniref:hypothetical protein n=1 Tax=unclassified Streptomyces TaxID=2593676 RepID=UPI0036C4BA82